jgi:hypothetical protein
MTRTPTSQTTSSSTIYSFDPQALPFCEEKDFKITSFALGEGPVGLIYGVFNKLTGHTEMVWPQLAQAVIAMQTAQQTLDRIRTGEANGIVKYD